MKHKLLILCTVCLVLAGCAGGVGGDQRYSHDLDSEDHQDGAHDDGDEKAHHTDDGEENEEDEDVQQVFHNMEMSEELINHII